MNVVSFCRFSVGTAVYGHTVVGVVVDVVLACADVIAIVNKYAK